MKMHTGMRRHHLCVVRQSLETYGCPLAYYVDNHSIFRSQTEGHTQFSRALAAVGVSVKFTKKAYPEAKDQAAYCTPFTSFEASFGKSQWYRSRKHLL